MSPSAELQALIVARLRADPAVSAIVGNRVYDNVPSKNEPADPYISFGPSQVLEDDAECITGIEETVQLNCWSSRQGSRVEAKDLTWAVQRSLHNYDGQLTQHALVFMRIEQWRLLDDPDGIRKQGVVMVTAVIEEN